MRFTLGKNVAAQSAAVAAAAGINATPGVPDQVSMYVTLGITILQMVLSIVAQFRNPDGTKATAETATNIVDPPK